MEEVELSFIHLLFVCRMLFIVGIDSIASMNGAGGRKGRHFRWVPVTGAAAYIKTRNTEDHSCVVNWVGRRWKTSSNMAANITRDIFHS